MTNRNKKIEYDESPYESPLLVNWGNYIYSLPSPGPGERADPQSGIYGTKCQALGHLVTTMTDMEVEHRDDYGDPDLCDQVQTIIQSLTEQQQYVAYGYYMVCNRVMDNAIKTIPHPRFGENTKMRYTRPELCAAINEIIYIVEKRHAAEYTDINDKIHRSKIDRSNKLAEHYARVSGR